MPTVSDQSDLPIVKIVSAVLDVYPDTQGIYLYGSYVTGDAQPDSDLDLAVLLPHAQARASGLLYFSPLFQRLCDLTGRQVDLINLRQTSTVLGNQIVSFGRRIFVGDLYACDEFEALNLSLYQKLNDERAQILADFLLTKRAYAV